jgi:protease-4
MAGGRVYTGQQAKDLGLVDEIGTLNDAIAYAAKKVDLDDYEIRTFPEKKNFLEELLADLGDDGKEDNKRISAGIWSSVAPALAEIDRDRVSMVYEALQQLDFLQQERVMLTMPVLRLQDH